MSGAHFRKARVRGRPPVIASAAKLSTPRVRTSLGGDCFAALAMTGRRHPASGRSTAASGRGKSAAPNRIGVAFQSPKIICAPTSSRPKAAPGTYTVAHRAGRHYEGAPGAVGACERGCERSVGALARPRCWRWPAAILDRTTIAQRWTSRPPTAPARRPPPAAWPSADWWRGFRSPELNCLIDQARRENFDLLAAIARVQQADAQVRIAGAGTAPQRSAHPAARVGMQESVANYGRTARATHNNIDVHDYSAGPQRLLHAGLLGQDAGNAPGGGGERHVQPVRPADRGADRGDQRRQHLVQRARLSPTSLRCSSSNLADAEQTLAVIRGRLEAGTASALDCRAAGGAGRWRARHHPRPAQPDGAADHRTGHSGRPSRRRP